jgi:hypothetical protein
VRPVRKSFHKYTFDQVLRFLLNREMDCGIVEKKKYNNNIQWISEDRIYSAGRDNKKIRRDNKKK